jgi:uncharacterized membrane protein YciS (DUF1049 family)
MIRKIVRVLILAPLAIILVSFAVANRQIAVVSFDPFDQANPAFAMSMPLFVLIIVLLIIGVIIGGVAAWLRQNKWRRAARQSEAQARRLALEIDALKSRTGDVRPNLPAATNRPRLTVPPAA